MVPIFGHIRYLRNVEFLRQYGRRVILCTTTKETKEFNTAIEHLAHEHGFKIFRSDIPLASKRHKPNPWRLFTNTLNAAVEQEINKEVARDEIIRDSFVAVDSEYCIFIDGDTVAKESFDKLIGLMKEKDYDVASVRVLASRSKTVMEKLQSLEYELAMDARKIYPWLTSGAGVVTRAKTIKQIMSHHSLFFSGGDIEIGKLANMLKCRVGHLHFEFYTDVPATFGAWFKQRVAWFGGGFRHAIVNFNKETWKHPMFFFYTTILVYGTTPLRWYEIIKHPYMLLLVILVYWILVFLFHWKKIGWFFLLFPFYALLQVMVLVPIGMFSYLRMAYVARNAGIIKLRSKRTLKKVNP